MLNTNRYKIQQYFQQSLILVSLIILLLFAFAVYITEPAFAHRPHDVVDSLEVSPDFDQDQTLFILVRHNVFKSTDGGKSWTRLFEGLDYQSSLSDLVLAPNNKKILYISSDEGTIYRSDDEGNSWKKVNPETLKLKNLTIAPNSSDLLLGVGEKELYRTTDAGKTWSKVLEGSITAITFFPNKNPKILLGDQQGQLYLSEDEGANWKKINSLKDSGPIEVIAFSPKFDLDSTFFVGTEQGGIYKTTDGGKSFEKVNQGLSDLNIRDIAISQNYPENSTLFATAHSEGVFISTDGGKMWKQYQEGIVKDHQADEFKVPHFYKLAIANKANNILYLAGFNGLFQSTDGGHTWGELETLAKGTVVALAISPDYKNDSSLALGTYVGMPYISRDKGQNWEVARQGLELPYFTNNFKGLKPGEQDPRRLFDIAFSPNYSQDKTIIASYLWDRIIKSRDGGKSWKIIRLPKALRGSTLGFSPNFAVDQTVYIATQQDKILRSTDSGETFTEIGKVGSTFSNYAPSLVVSPSFAVDKTLYVTGDDGIYKTVDGGQKWELTTPENSPIRIGSLQLVISPDYQADQTVFVGTINGVYQSRDAGGKWVKVNGITDRGREFIEAIAVSPNYQNDKTWIVNIRGKGLYKTVDDGKSFQPIGDNSVFLARMGDVPSAGRPLQFSPAYATDNTLFGYGAANTAIYRSTDGGNTWEKFSINTYKESGYHPLTSLRIYFYIYQKSLVKILIATMTSLIAYFALGYFPKENTLSLKRWKIKLLGAFVVFVVSLVVVFKFL